MELAAALPPHLRHSLLYEIESSGLKCVVGGGSAVSAGRCSYCWAEGGLSTSRMQECRIRSCTPSRNAHSLLPCPLIPCSPAWQAQGSVGGRGGGCCSCRHRRAWGGPAAAVCAGAPQQLWRADVSAALPRAACGMISLNADLQDPLLFVLCTPLRLFTLGTCMFPCRSFH